MTKLLLRSLGHYWRTNAAVVMGVAAAVAVLAGALVVGESVRESLRRIALRQLGRTGEVVEGGRFFGEGLAARLAGASPSAPLLALTGVVTHQSSGRRAGEVAVYGVDERFWAFHGVPAPLALEGRDAVVGATLAADLESAVGDTLLVRLPPPTEIPGSSLFGRRDAPGRSLRVNVRATLPAATLGEFSIRPRQRPVSALFVPLRFLQKSLGVEGRVNTVLLGEGSAPPDLQSQAALEDLGLRLEARPEDGVLVLESTAALLADDIVGAALETARESGLEASEVLIYLANEMRSGDRTVPYSLVAALDPKAWEELSGQVPGERSVLLNAWAAEDIRARPGEEIRLTFYLWEEEGRLDTRTTSFTFAGVVPMSGLGASPRLVPEYPGITESAHISDWDPPFPVDLAKIRPRDESYWDRYRAAPKAFVPLAAGQELWGHRLGRVTSIRLRPPAGAPLDEAKGLFETALRRRLDPARAGLVAEPVRAQALLAARGSTDFGEYFVYFSFFLVAAALLLAGLFFRLGVEQRLREIGLLRSVGYARKDVRLLFLAEGVALSVIGALLGIAGAFAYADLVVRGLRTLWVGAVGTRELALHASPPALVAGFAGGVLMAALAVAATLRGLRSRSPRSLLTGVTEEWAAPDARRNRVFLLPAGGALLLLLASALGRVSAAGAFFGAGGLLLVAALLATAAFLRGRRRSSVRRLVSLGFRGASFRPGRSVLCVALVAAASFVIVSVGSFRREAVDTRARDGESGGYTLLATSLLPLHSDPGTVQGQQSLSLPREALEGVEVARFRLRKGEDASCLNLYRPRDPTILAPSPGFLDAGRFSFQSSLARTPEEKANPWRLLDGELRNGAIPVIADASSLAYVLHVELGEEMEVGGSRVVFVGALRPGLFQGELLMGERHFRTAFPDVDGYRLFLLDAPPERQDAVTDALESGLSDYGLDVSPTAVRLAAYHRVENTYISTFQALGALGLVLGTVGLGAVLLRNVFERRRELALLQAVGYRRRHLSQMVLAENLLLLVLGLGLGTLTALVAVLPALRERPGVVPFLAVAVLLLAVLVVGLGASRLGVIVLRRLPLLDSLRSE